MFKWTPLTSNRAGTRTQMLCLSFPAHSLLSHDQLTYTESQEKFGKGLRIWMFFWNILMYHRKKGVEWRKTHQLGENRGFVILSHQIRQSVRETVCLGQRPYLSDNGCRSVLSWKWGSLTRAMSTFFIFWALWGLTLPITPRDIPLYTRFLATCSCFAV